MSHDMSHSSGGMSMVFTTSSSMPLFSNSWTPETTGAYAGTCIFLILLATILRAMFAAKSYMETQWQMAARKRRYILIKGQTTEAGRIDQDPDAKSGSILTAQGVEENVKIIQANPKVVIPFRLSVDVPRAAMATVITGVSYLLMLAVMTMNVGYFLSVLGGTFLGELLVGRYTNSEEHMH